VSTDRPIKVLMLDPPASVCAVTHNLCNALADLGCEVHVFTGPDWTQSAGRCATRKYQLRIAFYRDARLAHAAARSRIARLFWRGARAISHLWAMAKLWTVIRQFDVIHVQWLPVPELDLVWLWLVSKRAPVFYTVHNQLPHHGRATLRIPLLWLLLYRIPRTLFVHTHHTALGLVDRFGVSPERIVEIRHGNMQHLLELRPSVEPTRPAAAGEAVILILGQIRPEKGLDVLLRAADYLRRRVPNFRVLVVGRPMVDMRPYFELVQRLGLSGVVEFRLGYIEEDALPAWLERATVVALPYRAIDQSGIAVAACTLGKALVATRCGGLEELVRDADNGILVPVDDAQRLAAAIGDVLCDEGRRRRYEANSLKYARETLSWQPIAETTLATYLRHGGAVKARPLAAVAPMPRARLTGD